MHVTDTHVKSRTAVRASALLATLVFTMAGAMVAIGSAHAAAPQGAAQSTRAHAPAAVPPTISPSVVTEHVSEVGGFTCHRGELCTQVWDPTVSRWKVFHLYNCRMYSLSNWLGSGYFVNNQTGNAVASFYDQNGRLLFRTSPDNVLYPLNWDPIWYIRNC